MPRNLRQVLDKHGPLLELEGMKSGDFLEYANGERVKIVNFMLVNGEPGIQLDDPNQMFVTDRFKPLHQIEADLRHGVLKHIPKEEI